MGEMAEEKTKIAIAGWGNVGRGVYESIKRNPDMDFAGIITRRPFEVKKEFPSSSILDMNLFDFASFDYSNPLSHSDELWFWLHGRVDVAVLCGGSKNDLPVQGPFFARHINTVDSFDTHANIPEYFDKMNKVAEKYNHTSIISAGWDPGTFSLERVLADAFIPGAKNYTFWGPGVSQGHSDAVRKIEGVLDARQYTLPIKKAIKEVRKGGNPELTTRQKHKRLVYVVTEKSFSRERIAHEILTMPNYFANYDTTVRFISKDEMKKNHTAYPHGGFVLTSGTTGNNHKALIEYRNGWDSNPEATGNILIACARACHRMNKEEKSGAYTMLDIPPAYYSPRTKGELLSKFM